MLEKIWPFARFGRNKFRKALDEALEKAFEGADFEPNTELVEEEGRRQEGRRPQRQAHHGEEGHMVHF